MLAIYDRGARGLGGPTRADSVGDESEPRDFVNFLRNVGQPSSRQMRGGTFGYGKAVIYRASQLHTICVHTHCSIGGLPESRFIVSALGPQYQIEGQERESGLYTGRHWWGRRTEDFVEPVCGQEADDLALALGLPEFAPGERGTTALIINPIIGDRTPTQAMHFMAYNLLWYFWPKVLESTNGTVPMVFELSLDGQTIPVLDPRHFPPLHGFVQAMQNLKGGATGSGRGMVDGISSIASYRPAHHLGLLSLHRFPVRSRQVLDVGGEWVGSPIGDLCHHVALMRNAELVVRYLPGPALPTDRIEYAGVFVTDEEVDGAFAKAEPPTHDDWTYQSLEDSREKSFVRVALRRIHEVLDEFTAPSASSHGGGASAPLGAFAEQLGGLLPGEVGPGASIQPAGGGTRRQGMDATGSVQNGSAAPDTRGTSPRQNRAKLKLLDEGRLGLVNGNPAFLAEFVVDHADGSSGTEVRVQAGAILDGDEMELEPPAGCVTPRVIHWLCLESDSPLHPGSQEIIIPYSDHRPWQVAVNVPDDLMVGMILAVKEIG